MGLFNKRVCVVLLVVSILVICANFSQAKEDPELRQCKHQCRHQRQFDERQKLGCERSCEDYIRQKERIREEREKEREVSNPRRDPEKEYRICRERCQDEEEGRREQQFCESKCERIRKREEGNVEFDREREREWERKEEEEGREESGNPYVFQEEHFSTQIRTQEGRVRVLPKFTKRSNLFKGIENYRVLIFETNPQTFVVPNHWDADAIFFVAQGKGTVSLVFTDRRESFNIEQGHVMVVPAGVTAYLINRDDNQKLILAKLINPVSNPGKFEPFFASGGENPESLFNAFSDEVLEAIFKISSDKVQRLFSQQREGVIIKATEEQIRALSQKEGTRWPFIGKSSKDLSPVNILEQRPKESNEYGNLFEIDIKETTILKDLGIGVSFANITEGAMHAPYYNSRATKIAVVTNGEGRFEMACPHVSQSGHEQHHQRHHDSGRSRRGQESETPVHYQKISADLRPGTVFVVPPGHPFVTIASQNQNLEVVCFEINAENNHKFPLAGQKNVLKNIEREAKELAFATSAEEVDSFFKNQDEEFFFPGPRQERRHRDFAIL